jgi:ribosome-binding factor A
MESRRSQRVGDLIRHEVAQILQKDVKDPRVQLVTLTGVAVSPDLRSARVYFTVLGDTADPEETGRGLASARPFIRRELAQRLRLKAVPEIRFIHDESIDRGFRILEILDEVEHEPEEPSN